MSAADSTAADASTQDARIETFKIGEQTVPRLFVGLWQLSSPAWGTAPRSKIMAEFQRYVDAGFTAYGESISSGGANAPSSGCAIELV